MCSGVPENNHALGNLFHESIEGSTISEKEQRNGLDSGVYGGVRSYCCSLKTEKTQATVTTPHLDYQALCPRNCRCTRSCARVPENNTSNNRAWGTLHTTDRRRWVVCIPPYALQAIDRGGFRATRENVSQ